MKRFFGIIFLLVALTAFAQTNYVVIGPSTNSIRLGWCPSPSENVSSYRLAWGTGDVAGWAPEVRDTNYPPCERPILQAGSNWFRTYTTNFNVGNVTTCIVTGLVSGVKYYFSVIAEGPVENQAPPSNEIMYQVLNPPLAPRNLRLQ